MKHGARIAWKGDVQRFCTMHDRWEAESEWCGELQVLDHLARPSEASRKTTVPTSTIIRILAYLREFPGQWFTAQEIADANQWNARTVTRSLRWELRYPDTVIRVGHRHIIGRGEVDVFRVEASR